MNSIDPKTKTFREFPDYVQKNLSDKKETKIAMFCTGGVRCEKASAYMKSVGYNDVYHLKGGILQYLEDVPEENSLFRGSCFVFDRRTSVRHGLQQGSRQGDLPLVSYFYLFVPFLPSLPHYLSLIHLFIHPLIYLFFLFSIFNIQSKIIMSFHYQ